MPDRVKEAVFNMLGHRWETPGALPPLGVADVFAGGGSMGFEALSRGAHHCTFFERDRAALVALKRNLAALDAESLSTIVRYDGWRSATAAADDKPFDLIMLDPPYRDTDDTSPTGRVRVFLRSVPAEPEDGTLVLLHHRATVRYDETVDDDWSVVDHRISGTHGITLLKR